MQCDDENDGSVVECSGGGGSRMMMMIYCLSGVGRMDGKKTRSSSRSSAMMFLEEAAT